MNLSKAYSGVLGACLLAVVSAPASAANPPVQRIVSAAICQAKTPAGAALLVHNGSSLQAVGADVTVVCPILRTRPGHAVLWVDARHHKPAGAPANETQSGAVYSCDSTWGGCWTAGGATSHLDAGPDFQSVFVNSGSLPDDEDHYFYYHTVLKDGWKLLSIEYKEAG